MSDRITRRQLIPQRVIDAAITLSDRSFPSSAEPAGLDSMAIAVVGVRARRMDMFGVIAAPLVVALLWLAIAAGPALLG